MPRLSDTVVQEVVNSCLDLYEKLPKSGKPVEKEWTVLSCVVQYNTKSGLHSVVSLGTGSKCIGASKMSPKGDLLNDSHAEVIARRGLLLYIYENIKKTIQMKPSIFSFQNKTFLLEDNIEFLFYSSQLPCGDASITQKDGDEEYFGDVIESNKRKTDEDLCDIEPKRQKVNDADIHRTGAKCLLHSEQDPKQPGVNYHLLGQVRTKPGRGDRTLSVSCSDKMARWIHVGIQGALLNILCGPIYIKHFIFGSGVPYSEESLTRALLKRGSSSTLLEIVPEFYQSLISFPYVRNEDNNRPAPGSIVWSRVLNQASEVTVHGRKLGLTKKKAILAKHSLCISKYKLYEQFIGILQSSSEIKQQVCKDCPLESIPYNEMKKKSKRYLENWSKIQETFFKIWTIKPDLWNFYVSVT